MFKNQPLLKGYDYSYSQYVEQLKTHININLDTEFKDLFSKKFYTRYQSVNTIMDNFDDFFAMLEAEFQMILPLYEKKYLYIKSLNDGDLYETAHAESETVTDGTQNSTANSSQKSTTNSSQKSKANSKSYGSGFPSEMIDHDSLEYATDGTTSKSDGEGTSKSDSQTDSQTDSKTTSKNTVGSRIDRMEKMLYLQQNIFEECVNQFKKLFIMIY